MRSRVIKTFLRCIMSPMTAQSKSIWRRPGLMAFIAIIMLANIVGDWWFFKPKNVVVFLIAEAAVLCAVVLVALRRTPPDEGDPGAGSGDVANLVP